MNDSRFPRVLPTDFDISDMKGILHDLAIFKERWNLLLRVFLFGATRLSRFDFLAVAEAPSSTLPAFLKGSCR